MTMPTTARAAPAKLNALQRYPSAAVEISMAMTGIRTLL
jgi:hypothetical protein